MTDCSPPSALASEPGSNLPVFGVSELSQQIKRALESGFEHVRVRGEISGFKRAASGHLYLALKDQDAVLDAVCWRGTAGRLGLKPEDGMEVIATGRITSYPARSRYQLVIEQLELAGEGALLKLLEERRKALAAEGLFDAARKRPLPYLPSVIGVVTSPTGAVIRDILHRLADRFPRHVLVWPVLVQGEGAAAQIAAAIEGFNALPQAGLVPRPDVLIVARGGGSLEDLWAFNEEIVVRAAAASTIPLISAVGHETDTTLIDYASDRRAPTPTAAAEIAVPVRGELVAGVMDLTRRVVAAAGRMVEERRQRVEGLGRGLPDPRRLLEDKTQRLDDRAERLANAMAGYLRQRTSDVQSAAVQLPDPRHQLERARERLAAMLHRFDRCAAQITERSSNRLAQLDAERRLLRCRDHLLAETRRRIDELGRVLESVSYHKVLERGFAVVRGPDGVIMDAAAVTAGLALDIEFRGKQHAAAVGAGGPSAKPQSSKSAQRKGGKDDGSQGSLL